MSDRRAINAKFEQLQQDRQSVLKRCALGFGCEAATASSREALSGVAAMNNRAKLIATLAAAGVAGALIVSLALGAASGNGLHADHDKAGSVPMCSSASSVSNPTFYSEIANVNARMHEGMEVEPRGNVDRDFMRMMIPHHQGAIDMAMVQLKYGRDERLRRLAQSIIVEQGQEIAYMHSLLDTPPGEPTTTNRIADQ
jgi:hypothetical protein